jgi:hypothetical protein
LAKPKSVTSGWSIETHLPCPVDDAHASFGDLFERRLIIIDGTLDEFSLIGSPGHPSTVETATAAVDRYLSPW